MEPVAFNCSQCGSAGERHSAAECIQCYRRRALTNEVALLAGRLTHDWARALFEKFAAQTIPHATLSGHSRSRWRAYAQFFEHLGLASVSGIAPTAERMAAEFSPENLRRHRVPYAWLLREGQAEAMPLEMVAWTTENLAQDRLLARVREPWQLELLKRYRRSLAAYLRSWRARGWGGKHERFTARTVTLSLRAAFRLLESMPPSVVSAQGIDRPMLERFVESYPGHRNALHSFVGFLNRKERLFQRLHLDRSVQSGVPFDDLLTPQRAGQLRQEWFRAEEGNLRNALLGVLMLLYARTGIQACSLRRGAFQTGAGGSVQARFAEVAIDLDDGTAALLTRYLARLEATRARPLKDDDLLFESLVPGRAFSTAGLRHVLRGQGVTAAQLYTTALASFFRAGLATPKVLVRTLGISNQTAVKYWAAFAPRIRDEVAQAGRLKAKPA